MTESMRARDERPPAEIYDERFVPALFGPWAAPVLDHARVEAGHAVLDIGCGTGALTLAASRRIGTGGSVVGLDINDAMLAVAQRKPIAAEWIQGDATALPFDDARFDRVVSQFALMFFPDVPGALREMLRVLRPGGRLTVAVCDGLDHSPGYAVFTELLHRLFGPAVAEAFRAPFALGDRRLLERHAAAAGLPESTVTRRDGAVDFESIAALVSTERACAWTLGGQLDDDQFERLVAEAEESLAPFAGADGKLTFTMPCLLVAADKP